MSANTRLPRNPVFPAFLGMACLLCVALPCACDGCGEDEHDITWDGIYPLQAADAKLVGADPGDHAGWSMAGAGDVNGDGLDDIVIGGCNGFESGERPGVVHVRYGPVADGLSHLWTSDAVLHGEQTGDDAGCSVDRAGDSNGDGYGDILIGAYREDSGGQDAGAAYLVTGPISGETSLADADTKFIGEVGGDMAGFSVSTAGDVNGDGLDDLLIGALYAKHDGTSMGAAYLVLEPTQGEMDLSVSHAKLVGEQEGDQAGFAVSEAGDVNGDGVDDILVGAPYYSGEEYHLKGAAYLLLGPVAQGATSLANADARIIGKQNDYTGIALSAAGDVNGDGHDDLIVGALFVSPWGMGAYLFYGPIEGDHGLTDADADFHGSSDIALGLSLTGVGDVNGDSYGDVLVGDPVGSLGGSAYLLFGPLSGELTPRDADVWFLGETESDDVGWSVGGALDVDGDGYDDLLVGAYRENTGGHEAGAVYLVRASSILERF